MPSAILAIDQGTTSTRCILFDHEGQIMAAAQEEHRQIYPKPGWVEHDAIEIWEITQRLQNDVLRKSGLSPIDIAAIGITNQRETTVIWDRITGKPIYHAIVGLTRYANKGHFARAALEATAFQTREILDAMTVDIGHPLSQLKVDGGMVVNQTLMQFQADVLGVSVIKPKVSETTALGAAFSAGLAVGFWKNLDELRRLWAVDRIYDPKMDRLTAQRLYGTWQKAVERTFNWAE